VNWLFMYHHMLALGQFVWGCGDILFEDTRDPVCTFLGCVWPR